MSSCSPPRGGRSASRPAVEALTARLGAAFAQACASASPATARRGHGMGKSGHVAGKIAATLASTGTPASFCTLRKPGTVTSA